MRGVQRILLIICATALGASPFVLGLFCYVSATDSGAHSHNDLAPHSVNLRQPASGDRDD
jgi:hypothetical protein